MTKQKKKPDTNPTYAQLWAKAINETYDQGSRDARVDDLFHIDGHGGDEDPLAVVRSVLNKAARLLRGYEETATFTGQELDLVRHLMPAHEVHQSGSVRWVLDNYGREEGSE